MIIDLKQRQMEKNIKFGATITFVVVFLAILAIIAVGIYAEYIQISEIGVYSQVFVKNLIYKAVFAISAFMLIFLGVVFTNVVIAKNLNNRYSEIGVPKKRFHTVIIAFVVAFFGALGTKEFFYMKALSFLNSVSFNKVDPLFAQDIGYYFFQRPFLMSMVGFFSGLWLFICFYTAGYYLYGIIRTQNISIDLDSLEYGVRNIGIRDFKIKSVIGHNLFNITGFFLIKALSYKFQMEDLLYSNFVGVTGAGYIDANIIIPYYKIVPYVLMAIVILSLIFLVRGRFRLCLATIGVYPTIWIVLTIFGQLTNTFYVKPNEANLEMKYLKYNIEKTREAFNLDKIKKYDFPRLAALTPNVLERNSDTKNSIRIVDVVSTLDSDKQIQSNTNFYTFYDGDIINYNINGKDTPVFITAREIEKSKLPDRTPLNTVFKYTHGYGVVINPINKISPEGQVDFILSGLRMDSNNNNLKIEQPKIYYGELTNDHVIVNAKGLNEIDYDGNAESRYDGKGGIKLGILNRLLFALKYGDFNMLISGFVNSESKLLLNRQIIDRAKMALPFLEMDNDPYIILTDDGKLKWVIDAYTVSDKYPYANHISDINYIRNSVKIIVDAYDGTLDCYVIDKEDPIIKVYDKIYPGILKSEPLPKFVKDHMRYPEVLFKIQTEIMKRYHLESDQVAQFYTKQDLWDVAKYHQNNATKDYNSRLSFNGSDKYYGDNSGLSEIAPYYNMIKLPGNVGDKEELVLMRPYTPSGDSKHNMVSWLAVRNSFEHYGEIILFNFPKNTNILGPNQIDVKINQIDKISKDMTLWGQSGSSVYKGDLMVIPIESSVLYVQPIYIRATGSSSIPEIREIVVGYQDGDEFKYGIGLNLDDALSDLFKNFNKISAGATGNNSETAKPVGNVEVVGGAGARTDMPAEVNTGEKAGAVQTNQKTIEEIQKRYDLIKKQLDEMGSLIEGLKKNAP